MEKTAQFPASFSLMDSPKDLDKFNLIVSEEPEGKIVEEEEEGDIEDNEVILDGQAGPIEYNFKLSLIPGSEDDVVEEEEPEVVMDEATNTPADDWEWEKSHGVTKFLDWLTHMFGNVPKHSGSDTTGVERALAYFERLNTEISRAMKKDYKREIDASKAEQARTEIEQGLERLIERLEKLKSKKFKRYNKQKKAELMTGLVKTAETSMKNMVVTVPYLISNVARSCIEATVQGGRDMKDVFDKVASEYKLDAREKAQAIQLIKDMGYPIMLDRLNMFDAINPSSGELSEYQQQFYA